MSDVETAPEASGGEQETISREDELGSIFDEINTEAEGGEPEQGSEGRARDPETGRFVAKEENTAGEEAPPEEGEGAPAGEQTQAEPGAEQEVEAEETPALAPPASWSAASKALWPGLSPELQAEVLKREADWQRADGERANKLKGYEAFDAALEPVRQQLSLGGVEPAQYVRQLVAADQFLRTEPLRAVQWIAQTYGIDLSHLNQQAESIDPAVAPVIGRLQSVEERINQFINSQQNSELARVQAVIDAFKADPANKYAERLEDQIVAELGTVNALYPSASPEERLKKAYDRAVKLSEEVQAEIAAEGAAAAEAKRKKEAEDRAKKARITQTNLSSKGSSGGTTPPQFKDRDEELASIYDQLQGAA